MKGDRSLHEVSNSLQQAIHPFCGWVSLYGLNSLFFFFASNITSGKGNQMDFSIVAVGLTRFALDESTLNALLNRWVSYQYRKRNYFFFLKKKKKKKQKHNIDLGSAGKAV